MAPRDRTELTEVLLHLNEIAEEQKGQLKSDFAVNPAWRDELYRRLVADTVKIDKATYDAGGEDVDRALEDRVAKVAFGDTAVKRHQLHDDNQLRKAIELLRKSTTQKDVFAAAALMPSHSKPSLAGRGTPGK